MLDVTNRERMKFYLFREIVPFVQLSALPNAVHNAYGVQKGKGREGEVYKRYAEH